MRPRPDLRDREGGFTLPEVLVALIILGVAVTAIISSLGTSIVVSDVHRKLVSADAVVRTYAERLDKATYVECATPTGAGFYQPGPTGLNLPLPANFTASITSVEFWNGDNPATFTGTCPGNPDSGLQKITIEAHSNDNRGRQTLTILKRRP